MATSLPKFIANYYQRYKEEQVKKPNKYNLISSNDTRGSFAVFVYAILTDHGKETCSLCVYATNDEHDAWIDVLEETFSSYSIDIIDFSVGCQDIQSVSTHTFVLISNDVLLSVFPLTTQLLNNTSRELIQMIYLCHRISTNNINGFIDMCIPVSTMVTDELSPYNRRWSCIAVSQETLSAPFMFHINSLAVIHSRYLLCDLDASNYTDNELKNALSMADGDLDTEEDLECAVEDAFTCLFIEEDDINFAVIVEEPKAASSVPVLPIVQTHVPNLHSEIVWQSEMCPCQERMIDPSSRVSALWIHNQELSEESQQLISKLKCKTEKKNAYTKFITQEKHAHHKIVSIVAYVWSNVHRQFYIMCPYISKMSELHQLPNARAIHPLDDVVSLMTENDTIIVFDTIFACDKSLGLLKTRCKIIFATFAATREEDALVQFLFLNANLPAPTIDKCPRLSKAPIHNTTFDVRKLAIQFDLTSILYYDHSRKNPYCTMYAFMAHMYDEIVGAVGSIYNCATSTFHQNKERMSVLYKTMHVAECADTAIISQKELRKFIRLRDRLEEQHTAETQYLSRQEQQKSKKRIRDTMYHFLNTCRGEILVPDKVNDVSAECTSVFRSLVVDNLNRIDDLCEYLERKDELFSVQIVYNEKSRLLRDKIDLMSKPSVPARSRGKSKTYSCSYCTETFTSRAFYKEHSKYAHVDDPNDTKVYECHACDVRMRGQWQFIRHIRSNEHNKDTGTTQQMHTCQYCVASYSRKSSLTAHIKERHPHGANVNLFCTPCLKFVEGDQRAMVEHRLSDEHITVTRGETQIFCEPCNLRILDRNEMRAHLASREHEKVLEKNQKFDKITIHFNKWYMLLASVCKLIDQQGHYNDSQLRKILISFNTTRELLGSTDVFNDYATLICIAMSMRPNTRKLHISSDLKNGILTATTDCSVGIVGHFGTGDKTSLIAEIFDNMNVHGVGYAAFAYVPTGLQATLATYSESLGMIVEREDANLPFLKHLSVYHSYWIHKPNIQNNL